MPCRYEFPDPRLADPEGEGLVAVGGDLAPDTLICAYRQGIFPWFSEGDPIMWWSPEPRCIIDPHQFSPSKSLKRHLKHSDWIITLNRDFTAVIQACSEARAYANDTWINPEMIAAYQVLYQQNIAYSIEVWDNENQLIGGLYGLKIGQAFFGESMFHRRTDASKVAFFALMRLCAQSGFRWVDCQLPNAHLLSLGASVVDRDNFLTLLDEQIDLPSCDWSSLVGQCLPASTLLTPTPLPLLGLTQ